MEAGPGEFLVKGVRGNMVRLLSYPSNHPKISQVSLVLKFYKMQEPRNPRNPVYAHIWASVS